MSSEQPQLHYEFTAPDAWLAMTPQRRESRGEILEDLCRIDNNYFIKGNLWIPIIDGEQEFNWTIWASLSKTDYERSIELWDTPGRELEPAYRGTLSNEIFLYPGTSGLKVQIITMGVGERPSFVLEEGDHSLITDQRNGISLDRLKEITNHMITSA